MMKLADIDALERSRDRLDESMEASKQARKACEDHAKAHRTGPDPWDPWDSPESLKEAKRLEAASLGAKLTQLADFESWWVYKGKPRTP